MLNILNNCIVICKKIRKQKKLKYNIIYVNKGALCY